MRQAAGIAAIAAAGLLAGCGGNDGPGEPSISIAAFRDRANSECAVAAKKAREIAPPANRKETADFGAKMGLTVQEMRNGLLAISEQTGGVDDTDFMATFDRYTGHLAEQLRALGQLSKPTLPRSEVISSFRMLRQPQVPKLALELGLKRCVEANDAIVKTP